MPGHSPAADLARRLEHADEVGADVRHEGGDDAGDRRADEPTRKRARVATLPGRVSFSERTSLKSRSPTGAAGSQRIARLKAKNQGYEPTKEATFSEIGEITLIAGHSRLPPSPAAAVSGPSLRYIETSRPATVSHAPVLRGVSADVPTASPHGQVD